MRTVDPVRHAARRRQILDAAAACFAEKGFDGTRTAEICARAGMSAGNLFHYFAGKQELVTALVEQERQETADYLARLVSADDPVAALLELLELVVELAGDPVYAGLALEISAAAHRDDAIAAPVTRSDRELREGISALVRRASVEGGIDRALDPVSVATWIAALIDGLFARVAVDPEFVPAEHGATLRLIVTRFLRAEAG